MNKFLFLDVDGVLNDCHDILRLGSNALGEDKLNRLKTLVHSTSCKVVLSSTWRLFPHSFKLLEETFAKFNVEIHSKTDDLWHKPRHHEIKMWLCERDEQDALVVILDDDTDAEIEDKPNCLFINTDFETGFQDEHLERAIQFFNDSLSN